MNQQVNSTMFNPFDGVLLASGTCVFSAFVVGSPSVLAAIAGAGVTGVFVLLAKCLELWWKGRTDKRVQELEQQLRNARRAQ